MTTWKEWARMDFPARFKTVLDERGETQSEFARRIWGSVINPKTGHSEAKHRDRITDWLKGRAYPNRENQRLIAETCGVTVEDLFSPPEDDEAENLPDGWSVSSVPGMPDAVLVRNSGMTPEALMLLFLRGVA